MSDGRGFPQIPLTVTDNVWEINTCPISVLSAFHWCRVIHKIAHWICTIVVLIVLLISGGTGRLSSLTQATQSLQEAESGGNPGSLTPEAHSKPSQGTASSAVGEIGRLCSYLGLSDNCYVWGNLSRGITFLFIQKNLLNAYLSQTLC